jgi:hypothetical protein
VPCEYRLMERSLPARWRIVDVALDLLALK